MKKQLNRKAYSRLALLKSLASAFVERGKIQTTLAKAKFAQPEIEKLITKSKEGSLAARRALYAFFPKKDIAEKLLSEAVIAGKSKSSGFTRLLKTGSRLGDRAEMASLEWAVSFPKKAVKEEKSEK